ncbi:hypothetical protein SBDP2_480001 [Syntrophobacter sp. SbD2]|nr:hypothetical protein SBDP2_480001 [Syntrophobacter sp. SbD2]
MLIFMRAQYLIGPDCQTSSLDGIIYFNVYAIYDCCYGDYPARHQFLCSNRLTLNS